MKTVVFSCAAGALASRLCVMAVLVFASLAPVRAQSAATGAISGRVQNEATGQYLNNARVTVKGTDLTVFTDDTGSFRLASVPAGPVVLEVLYSGLDLQQVPLTVAAGQLTERDINLNSRDRYGAATGTGVAA